MIGKIQTGVVPGLGIESEIWYQLPKIDNNLDSWLRGYHINEPFGHPMLHSWLWAPLIVVILIFGKERLKWLGAALLTLVIATGAVWPIGDFNIPMPHYLFLYHFLPFFDRLWFPYRIIGFTFICLSISAGILVNNYPLKRWYVGLVLFGVFIGLYEHTKLHTVPIQSREAIMPQVLNTIMEKKGGVIELPIGYVRPSIMWQTIHEQPTFGGMGENAQIFLPKKHERRLKNPFVKFLIKACFDNETTQKYSSHDLERIKKQGFRFVLLNREILEMELLLKEIDSGERSTLVFDVQRLFTINFGNPIAVSGPYILWDLNSTKNNEKTVFNNQYQFLWNKSSMSKYEIELQIRNRIPK